MDSPSNSPRVSEKSVVKVALTALAGTSIEWYDFFIYGTAAALVFPTLFFPPDMPPLIAQLASFSTFAVGFLARPLGGVIFGHFGDRAGRKAALVTALLMMGAATTLIGLLPTYPTAGSLATILLIVLRFVQGLAIGGQWAGAVLLATENAPPARRGFYGAFAQVGVPAGVILANLVFLVVNAALPADAFLAWGWRVPFLLSIGLIVLAIYMQLTIEETAEFRELQAAAERRRRAAAQDSQGGATLPSSRSPVLDVIRTHPREIMLAAGALMAIQVSFYIFTTFLIAYGTNPAGLALPRGTMLAAVLISAVLMIPALLISAHISDRYGRRRIFLAGAILVGVWGFVLFPMVDTGSFAAITLAMTIGQIFFSMMYGPQAALLAEMFSAGVRYSGASLGYQIGAILGGALTPMIATALVAQFQTALAVSVYIALACLVTIISIMLLGETHQGTRQPAEPARTPGTGLPAPG